MSAAAAINLASACAGALGTLVLFFGSFAYVQLAPYVGDQIIADVKAANLKRQRKQRVGLTLLLLSFVLQGAVAVLPTAPPPADTAAHPAAPGAH